MDDSIFENEYQKMKAMVPMPKNDQSNYIIREDNLRLLCLGFYLFGRSIEKEETKKLLINLENKLDK